MYLKVVEIMEKYNISRSTACRILHEMQQLNRYPKSAIIGGRCCRIEGEAFQDYMENRQQLKHPSMKKYVKPYKGGNK